MERDGVGGRTAGCPQSSADIDLATVGELTLVISRPTQSSVATATAQVVNRTILSTTQRKIVLAEDQVLSVNGVALAATAWTALGVDSTVTATFAAVDPPATYAISFDNQGVVTSFAATPPADFTLVTPNAATAVPRSGFGLTWQPSGDADVTVDITITGLIWTYADGSWQSSQYSVPRTGLADSGAATIGATDLAWFPAGDITVTLTRSKTIAQNLGFSAGTIVLNIVGQLPLTLVDSGAMTTTG
jgi:hypothetical protein